ncbi:TetR family transcriptional regulator [Ovoidimarina sediminis]|uniref:TetR family transcriptional regulator n=1 Tax=Ovoidimarina sediminis TaxID=3079856 RepID=UPI0029137849|nr:TetR family transcriptional regulator [Rhodophyticola sp. MJ-SS7]MDU8945569.1 TetR family transcriptional regulator [Rhodophyticola sp. MJ-SS7]
MARKSGSHSEITRPRIRDAALRLFARHGFAAVSMRQIAAEVGVQAGAIYLYFEDKQALLFELMDTHMDDLLAAWEAVVLPEDALGRLRAFTRFHIAYHVERPDDVFIAYMELRSLTPGNFAVIETKRRAYERILEDLLEAGRADGVIDVEDVRITTMALIAMLTGVNTWYREGGRLARERLERIYWGMVERMITGARVPA